MLGVLKAIRRGGASGDEVNPQANRAGDLMVAQGLPPGTEITRQGGSYQAMTTSAVAALVVRPSTVALGSLWNGEPAGGKSYVIDRAFGFNLVSTAAQTFAGLWLCSHVRVDVSGKAEEITAFNSTSGRSGYGGEARFEVDGTVVDDGWYPWGVASEAEEAGVLPGGVIIAPVAGRIIVPPQGGISATVVSGVVGDTFTVGFHWHEVQL